MAGWDREVSRGWEVSGMCDGEDGERGMCEGGGRCGERGSHDFVLRAIGRWCVGERKLNKAK